MLFNNDLITQYQQEIIDDLKSAFKDLKFEVSTPKEYNSPIIICWTFDPYNRENSFNLIVSHDGTIFSKEEDWKNNKYHYFLKEAISYIKKTKLKNFK